MAKKPAVNDPNSRASRFRRKRFKRVEELLRQIIEVKGRARVLDVGGRRDYWDLAPPDLLPNLSLTLLNYDDELDVGRREDDVAEVEYLQGDGCDMPQYADGAFDLAHSNSVIEHVGSLAAMARFADETRRVGNAYYVQTPNLWFPFEPHFGAPFIHWLPAPTRAGIHHHYKLGFTKAQPDFARALASIDHIQLIGASTMAKLFPDGALARERVLLMTKSVIVSRAPTFD